MWELCLLIIIFKKFTYCGKLSKNENKRLFTCTSEASEAICLGRRRWLPLSAGSEHIPPDPSHSRDAAESYSTGSCPQTLTNQKTEL